MSLDLRPPALPPLAVALLVGGESRRFGRPKAMARLGARTLAEQVASALAEVAPDLVLLGGGEVPPSLAAAARLADAPEARGPLAGLLALLRARPDRAWLVAACDQPWLSGDLCRWLAGERAADRLAVLPRADRDRLHPFPGVYEPAILPALEALARDGRYSLQALARVAGVATPEVPGGLVAALRDVDRESDLVDPPR